MANNTNPQTTPTFPMHELRSLFRMLVIGLRDGGIWDCKDLGTEGVQISIRSRVQRLWRQAQHIPNDVERLNIRSLAMNMLDLIEVIDKFHTEFSVLAKMIIDRG